MTASLIAQMGRFDGGGFGPGQFLVWVLIPAAVVALVAYGVYELTRARTAAAGAGAPVAAGGAPSAQALLDERFVRGEIDAEEYLQRRALLGGTPPPPPAPATTPAATPTDPPTVESPTADQ